MLLSTGNNVISEYYANPFMSRVQADMTLLVLSSISLKLIIANDISYL
jgi:hypothetical protein